MQVRKFTLRALAAICRRRGGRAVPLADATAILVVKLDAIGDFVLVTPFLRELRHAAPRAHITLITGPTAAPLARTCPYVDSYYACTPDANPVRFGSVRRVGRYAAFLKSQVQARRFDFAFVPRRGPDHQHGRLLAYLSGAPMRVGFRIEPDDRLLSQLIEAGDDHEVEANLRLLRSCAVEPRSTRLELTCLPAERDDLRRHLERDHLDEGHRLVVLGVGASLDYKTWPAARFVELGRHLVERHGVHVIAVGDQSDGARLPPTRGAWHNWAGKLTLNQTWALLTHAKLFVGNDSAAAHLAAAAGCPVVLLAWQPANHATTGVDAHRKFAPYEVQGTTLHPRYDQESAARSLTVELVKEAVDRCIESLPLSRPHA